MIPTIHGTDIPATKKTHYRTGRRISKPISVQDYNENRDLSINVTCKYRFPSLSASR